MSPAQLNAFMAVIETGSFKEAAIMLGISQSAVSHAIKAFEKQIGVTVFSREHNNITLTEAGTIILPQIRQMVQLQKTVKQELESLKGIHKGHLKIGSFGPSFTLKLFSNIIQTFSKNYPNITTSLEEASDAQIKQKIRTGEIDFGSVIFPDDDMEMLDIGSDHLMVVMSEDNVLCHKPYLTLDDICALPLVLTEGSTTQIIMEHLKQKKLFPHHIYASHMQFLSMLDIIQNSDKISIIADYAISPSILKKFGLKTVPITPKIERNIYLSYRKNTLLSPAAKAFF